MGYTKTWARQFAEGFDEIVETQAYQLSEYVVVEGINEGHDIIEIERALNEYGNTPRSRQTIQRWIDKYGIAVGLGGSAPAGAPLAIGSDNLASVIAASGIKLPDDDDAYVQHYVKEGATLDVAKRIARGEKVGEWLADNDHWDKELDRIRPKALSNATAKASGKIPYDRWLSRWTTWLIRAGDMLTFLKATKQDQMQDSTVHRELFRLAAQFEKQAERFEVGFEKSKARVAARKV